MRIETSRAMCTYMYLALQMELYLALYLYTMIFWSFLKSQAKH